VRAAIKANEHNTRSMLALAQLKILDPVVGSLAVDVVNRFGA
jgi:hypothetical protein